MSTKPTLLIIDDVRACGDSLARVLRRRYEVTVLTSARDAVAKLEDGAIFDVILSDVRMPGMSGQQFFAEIGRYFPWIQSRIVFASGSVMAEEVKAFLGSIPNPRLEKPFTIEELDIAIAQVTAAFDRSVSEALSPAA